MTYTPVLIELLAIIIVSPARLSETIIIAHL